MPQRYLLDPSVFRRLVVRTAVVPAVVLALAGVLLLIEIRALIRSHREVHADDQTISTAYLVLKIEVDQQTGLRGYVLTGDPKFLAPYTAAQDVSDADLFRLRDQAGAPERGAMDQIIRLDRQWDAFSREIMDAKRRGDGAAATALITGRRGENLITAIRLGIRGVVGRVEQRRDARALRATRTADWVTTTIVLGTLVAIAALALLVRREATRLVLAYEVALSEEVRLRQLAEVEAAERKRAEDEVRQMNLTLERRVDERTAALQEVNRELEAFAYSVSHDLRAPIRHMSGFAQLLAKRSTASLDAESQRYLNTIREAAGDAGKLVDELLAFSRMGRTELRRAPVDLNGVVGTVLHQLRPDTEGRSIDWQIGSLPTVNADNTMLRLVFYNLLSNAIKFTRSTANARVEVCASKSDGEHVICVRDNGVGFDMRYADKLFGVFQRLHDQSEFEGVGIGLANVRRIVNRHGGRVWAEGSLGGGASFFFSLPAA